MTFDEVWVDISDTALHVSPDGFTPKSGTMAGKAGRRTGRPTSSTIKLLETAYDHYHDRR